MLRNSGYDMRINKGFTFNDNYKESLCIAIKGLINDIEVLQEEDRYFESNLAKRTLEKLVDDYRFCVGEYTLTYNIPNIYDYVN